MNQNLRHLLRAWVLPFADPRPLGGLARLPRFVGEWRRYNALAEGDQAAARDLWPCLADRTPRTPFDPHYFYQGAWLARRLAKHQPAFHVDVGSSVTMVSVLSAQVPIVFLDYRPIAPNLPGISPVAGNLTSLPFADRGLASISCLHVVEHVGLGRYGDPLDPRGSRRAFGELARSLAVGGRLYVSVPVGRDRVCFNAHRVFSPASVIDACGLDLVSFALVDDAGRFTDDVEPDAAEGLEYGCGMFEFTRQRENRP